MSTRNFRFSPFGQPEENGNFPCRQIAAGMAQGQQKLPSWYFPLMWEKLHPWMWAAWSSRNHNSNNSSLFMNQLLLFVFDISCKLIRSGAVTRIQKAKIL